METGQQNISAKLLIRIGDILNKEIIALTGSKSKIINRPLPEDDPKVRRPDTTRARSILDWEAKVDRKEGLRRTVEYFKTQIK